MSSELLTAAEIAPLLKCKPSTVLAWHRKGKITADVNTGRTVLFDPERVRKDLAKDAKKHRQTRVSDALPKGMVPTY